MGAEWGMKNIIVTTWYPGNAAEATQQNLGPQEMPSRWSGEWRRTMLGATPQSYVDDQGGVYSIVDPLSLWNALEAIARGGQRLRVVWGVTTDNGDPSAMGTVTRDGRIAECNFKPMRVQDIGWQVEFHWLGRGATTPKVTSTSASTVVSSSADFQNALQALIDANQQSQLEASNPTIYSLGDLEALSELPSDFLLNLQTQVAGISIDVTSAVTIAATFSSQPVAVQNNAVTSAQNAVVQSNAFYDGLSEQPYELMTENTQSLRAFLFALNTFAPQSDSAQYLAQEAQAFAAQLRSEVQSLNSVKQGTITPTRLSDPNNVLQIYTTKQGDTPALVSARMYNGSPDHAVDILIANGFPWYQPTFPSGIQLVIPRLNQTQQTQAV
jgi:phage tail protein X